MARATLLCVLAALLIAGAAAEFSARRNLQGGAMSMSGASAFSNTEDGDVTATASARSTFGMAAASVFASTETDEQAAAAVVDFYLEYRDVLDASKVEFPDEDECQLAIIAANVTLEAAPTAYAEVYTEAIGEGSVVGEGEACIDASAVGEAAATAFLQITSDIFLRADVFGNNSRGQAEVDAYLLIVREETALAWAEAWISGCTFSETEDGEGFILAQQTSFARATVTPSAVAYIWAEAGADCGEMAYADLSIGAENIESTRMFIAETESNVEVMGMGEADAGGVAGADVDEGDDDPFGFFKDRGNQCRTGTRFCCDVEGDTCTCTRTSRARCNAEKSEVEVPDEGTFTLWTQVEDEEPGAGIKLPCYCEN